MKDIVSEIIDQQVDPSELGEAINQVVRDRAACERWRNYHLIGDVIRGEVNIFHQFDLHGLLGQTGVFDLNKATL